MDGKKAALVAGLAAIAVVGWMVVRGGGGESARKSGRGSTTTTTTTTTTDPTTSGDPRVHSITPVIRVPNSVDQPSPDAAPPAHPALANAFDAESRDDGWADEHEREIGRRLGAIHVDGVTLDKTECKSDTCRISFTAADDHALGNYLHKLESPDALNGYAQMMVMEGITDTDDGKRQERVYARFAE